MNTLLTENQLSDIKKSLEHSLELVKRGLRHFSSVSPSTPVTSSIIESKNNTESIYYYHPEFLYHFQNLDVCITVVYDRASSSFSVQTDNFIPKVKPNHDFEFTHPFIFHGVTVKTLSELPDDLTHNELSYISKNCRFGRFETSDIASIVFEEFISMHLNYSEIPF